MPQVPEPRQFVEGLVEGLLQFVISLLRSWVLVALRPVAGALRLARDKASLNSRTSLFIATVVASALPMLTPRNLAEVIQGTRMSPAQAPNPWYSSYDQADGIWFYIVAGLLIFLFIEILCQFLAWSFSWGLASRRALLTVMLRFAFAPALIISTISGMVIVAPYLKEHDLYLTSVEGWVYLSTTASLYPVGVQLYRLAKPLRARWKRLLAVVMVTCSIDPIRQLYAAKAAELLLIPMFVPDLNASVAALNCTLDHDVLTVEAMLYNPGQRPIAVDQRYITVVVEGPPWMEPANSAGPQLDPDTLKPVTRRNTVEPQVLHLPPTQLKTLGPGSMLAIASTAIEKVKTTSPLSYYCRLEAQSLRLGIRSTNELIGTTYAPPSSPSDPSAIDK